MIWNVSTSVNKIFPLCLNVIFHFTKCRLFLAESVYLFSALEL
jgi:hypothetical protein